VLPSVLELGFRHLAARAAHPVSHL